MLALLGHLLKLQVRFRLAGGFAALLFATAGHVGNA